MSFLVTCLIKKEAKGILVNSHVQLSLEAEPRGPPVEPSLVCISPSCWKRLVLKANDVEIIKSPGL